MLKPWPKVDPFSFFSNYPRIVSVGVKTINNIFHPIDQLDVQIASFVSGPSISLSKDQKTRKSHTEFFSQKQNEIPLLFVSQAITQCTTKCNNSHFLIR